MACNSIRLKRGAAVSEANWADNLPRDLLDEICSRLVLLPDYIRFGAVCKKWLSIALNQKEVRLKSCHQQPPMLLIPKDRSQDQRNLYSVCEDKVYDCSLPIPHSKKYFGSSHGWWACAEKDLSMTLMNPFSGKTIHLPPIIECPQYVESDDVDDYDEEFPNAKEFLIPPELLIHKVILSCDPRLHPDDFVVAAIFGHPPTVVFIRSGDQFWNFPFTRFTPVNDIQFYRGRLYAVNCCNLLVAVDYSCDYNDPSGVGDAAIEFLVSRIPADVVECSMVSYLVESVKGELLLIRRLYRDDVELFNYEVNGNFKVYKLTTKHSSDQEEEEEEEEWVEIQSLGNSSLFLDDNHSTCISATCFPNCQPNCIYYSHVAAERDIDAPYEDIDMGVFHMENGLIEKLYDHPQSLRYKPPPVWICTKLQ